MADKGDSPIARAGQFEADRHQRAKTTSALYRRLLDVENRLSQLAFPADVQGHGIKVLADAIVDIGDVREEMARSLL